MCTLRRRTLTLLDDADLRARLAAMPAMWRTRQCAAASLSDFYANVAELSHDAIAEARSAAGLGRLTA